MDEAVRKAREIAAKLGGVIPASSQSKRKNEFDDFRKHKLIFNKVKKNQSRNVYSILERLKSYCIFTRFEIKILQ